MSATIQPALSAMHGTAAGGVLGRTAIKLFGFTGDARAVVSRAERNPNEGAPITAEVASSADTYAAVLQQYSQTRSEAALYQASLLSQTFIEHGLGPDEIVELHSKAVDQLSAGLPFRQRATAISDGMHFLLEVMIAYGVHHQQYLELRTQAAEQEASLAQLRASEADRLNQEKSEVLAAVAHELHSPLTAAAGMVELAIRALEREELTPARDRLRGAREALRRLGTLSADLHRASRNEPLPLSLSAQDLPQVVQQVCSWVQADAVDKGLQLHCPRQTAGPHVQADADALVTILSNLLSNAIRYTPAGGAVTVRVGQTPTQVWLEVRDTGIGIPTAEQPRIFDKFYRTAVAKQTVAQGLGLGLPLVQQLVTAQHGQISVRSAPGQGSTFRVVLPRADMRAEESHG